MVLYESVDEPASSRSVEVRQIVDFQSIALFNLPISSVNINKRGVCTKFCSIDAAFLSRHIPKQVKNTEH